MPIRIGSGSLTLLAVSGVKDLAKRIGITEANLSLLKQGRVKGVRFETPASICAILDCTPGDILWIEGER
ncbi:helix-turn-helix domain-containing protein [Sphingomonas sp.]|uniref:helix-turn-helix domain-containing protein n=1 Tax=Sphingomonas sp. TaxID=28214 RepID=UPI0032C22759